MTPLTDDAVALVERGYALVQRYEDTRDAALVDDRIKCQDWLIEAQRVLGNARAEKAAGPKPRVDPLERIADVLEDVRGETEDGVPYLRIVTGARTS
jgi:hypothetical protein